MNNDIQNLVNELNSTTPKTQMYMIQLCRSAINNLYDLTDTIEENISSLQTSVVANTSAISVLQSSIDVINTNLNAYVLRIATLENITTHMTSNEYNTLFNESIDVSEDIKAGGDVDAEGDIVGNALEVNSEEYGRGRFYMGDDGNMRLGLPLNAGILITTGNIEEYASDTKLYDHNITLSVYSAGSTYMTITTTILSKDATQFDKTSFVDYIKNNGFTTTSKVKNASGRIGYDVSSIWFVNGLYVSGTTLYLTGIPSQSGAFVPNAYTSNVSYWSSVSLNDVVIEI